MIMRLVTSDRDLTDVSKMLLQSYIYINAMSLRMFVRACVRSCVFCPVLKINKPFKMGVSKCEFMEQMRTFMLI